MTLVSAEDIKYWARSGSFHFMQDRRRQATARGILNWNSKPIYYRPGTSDLELIYRVLLKPEKKREYRFPKDMQPRTVLDIGANIGMTSVLLAKQYPNAKIFSFEPVAENFDLLTRNVAGYPSVKVFPYALGAQDEIRTIYFSDSELNQGGFSFFEAGSRTDRSFQVDVRKAGRFIEEQGITDIDLIKIDTEGSEFDILTALGPKIIEKVSWICGELHGQKDFELLHYLSTWFEIGIEKPVSSRLSHFVASKK